MDNSKLTLMNNSKYDGERRWKWNIWLEGPPSKIDQIESVRYFLHPTFRNPIVLKKNKEMKFMLAGSGWGEFNIKAEVKFSSNIVSELNHWLKLESDEKEAIITKRRGHVTISHSHSDGPFASILASKLISNDFGVTASAISDPTEIEEYLNNEQRKTDLNLILISPGMSDFIESYLLQSLNTTNNVLGNFIFTLLGSENLSLGSTKINTININSKSEINVIIKSIETYFEEKADNTLL